MMTGIRYRRGSGRGAPSSTRSSRRRCASRCRRRRCTRRREQRPASAGDETLSGSADDPRQRCDCQSAAHCVVPGLHPPGRARSRRTSAAIRRRDQRSRHMGSLTFCAESGTFSKVVARYATHRPAAQGRASEGGCVGCGWSHGGRMELLVAVEKWRKSLILRATICDQKSRQRAAFLRSKPLQLNGAQGRN
jgi:hypothetical protein